MYALDKFWGPLLFTPPPQWTQALSEEKAGLAKWNQADLIRKHPLGFGTISRICAPRWRLWRRGFEGSPARSLGAG